MKALVIYDSQFGTTEAVARTIGDTLDGAEVRHVGTVEDGDLRGLDLLIVGSPTQGGRPTKPIQALLNGVPEQALNHTKVAAFDTRTQPKGFLLRALMGLIGFAAPKITAKLRARGGTQVIEPAGFLVTGTKGPLQDGELSAAAEWAKGAVEVLRPAAVS